MPWSNGGFGSASQTTASPIATKIRRRSQPRSGGLQTADEATAVWKAPLLDDLRDAMRFTFRHYFVTAIFPPKPRPFTLRSYIDSANTAGTTKFPRLHDLI